MSSSLYLLSVLRVNILPEKKKKKKNNNRAWDFVQIATKNTMYCPSFRKIKIRIILNCRLLSYRCNYMYHKSVRWKLSQCNILTERQKFCIFRLRRIALYDYWRTGKTLIRLCACAVWSGSSLFASAVRSNSYWRTKLIFAWCYRCLLFIWIK